MIYFWIAVFFAMVFVELWTLGLTTIWFAVGGAAAGVGAALGVELWVQIVLFAVVSVVALIVTRPFANRFINSKIQASNLDELIGMEIPVIETVDNEKDTGKVKIQGAVWMARTRQDGEVLPEGTRCSICGFCGAKVIVKGK